MVGGICPVGVNMSVKEVTGRARMSTLPGSGVVKMPEPLMKKLGVGEGEKVTVRKMNRSLSLEVVEDTIYSEDVVRLRKQDMISLGVRDGDLLTITVKASAPAKKQKTAARGRKKGKKKR